MGSTINPKTRSVSSPTKPVVVMVIFNRHLMTMTIQPDRGPMAKPARSAGSSENCISKNDGNINGRGNFANAYNTKDKTDSTAVFARYMDVILVLRFSFFISLLYITKAL